MTKVSRITPPRHDPVLASAFRAAPRLYFLRIPKTASSSMLRVFKDAYPWWRQCRLFANWQLTQLTERDLTRLRCFYGHWGAGFLELLPAGASCITLLRDPVEQVVSWFQHMVRPLQQFPEIYGPEQSEWEPVVTQDLASALKSPFLLAYMSNMQTKFLGVPFDFAPWMGAGQAGIPGLRTAFHEAFREADPEQTFSRGMSTLKRLQVVGLSERFEESARLIADFVGVPAPRRTPQENIGPAKRGVDPSYHRAHLSPRLLDRLEELTEYDRELYRTAARLLEDRWKEREDDLGGTLRLGPTLHLIASQVLRRLWRQARRNSGSQRNDTSGRGSARHTRGPGEAQ